MNLAFLHCAGKLFMRVPRTSFLPQNGGLVHKFWRAHNRAYLLSADSDKNLYLQSIFHAVRHKSIASRVNVSAFCVMSNHAHMLVKYDGASSQLSSFMRIAHSRFGQIFNRLHSRQGAVAYDRPKTPLVQQSYWNQIRVHFYIEANPLRARMTRNLKTYKFSSYAFYAWGVASEITRKLTVPQWYLALGKTAAQRRSKYRSLFEAYLKEVRTRVASYTVARFIGDPLWRAVQAQSCSRVKIDFKTPDPPE